MDQKQIEQMFESRWRMKGNYGQMNQNTATMSFDEFFEYIKGLCKDFFEAGFLLADGVIRDKDGFVTSGIRFPDGSMGTVTYMHDPIVDSFDDGFEEWWNLYKKKRGKEKCQKKWKKLSVSEKLACIKATPAYVESTPDITYRKDPYTYLNNKSWQDEIYFRQTREQQQQQRIAEAANLVAKYTGADKGTKG